MMRMKDIRLVEGIMSGGHPALVLLIPEYAAALQRYSKSNRDKILREDVKRALLKGIPHRRVFALIKKGTTVRPLPTSKLSQHEVYSDMLVEKELLEVFCILRKWLCVVIPGFGLGWVPRQSAVEMTEIGMSPRICSPATLMRSVSFWNMIEAPDAEGMVVPLITLFFQMTGISDRLEDINISENRIGSPDQFGIPATEILHRIIYFSPYLTTLNLADCQLTNITPLLEAYKKGRCRIRSLNLDSNMLGFRGAFDLAMLLISDSQSPMGSWLTDLSLLFNDIDAIGTRALLEALQYNVHLEHLAIEYGNEFPGARRLRVHGRLRDLARELPLRAASGVARVREVFAGRAARRECDAPGVGVPGLRRAVIGDEPTRWSIQKPVAPEISAKFAGRSGITRPPGMYVYKARSPW